MYVGALGPFEVGRSQCALGDHSEVPGVPAVAGLSLGTLTGGKAGESRESWDTLSSPQCSTGVVTKCDGWAQVRPYSSPLPFRLGPIWPFLSFYLHSASPLSA